MDSGYYIRYNILDITEDKISDLKAVKTIRYKTGRKMTKWMEYQRVVGKLQTDWLITH